MISLHTYCITISCSVFYCTISYHTVWVFMQWCGVTDKLYHAVLHCDVFSSSVHVILKLKCWRGIVCDVWTDLFYSVLCDVILANRIWYSSITWKSLRALHLIAMYRIKLFEITSSHCITRTTYHIRHSHCWEVYHVCCNMKRNCT